MDSIRRKVIWTGLFLVCAVVPAASQFREPEKLQAIPTGSPTCDSTRINPDSYALATRAQAAIVTEDRLDWWDGFNVGNAFDALHDLNSSSIQAAERALELDPHNLLAHGVLARQYVVIGEDAKLAEEEWRTTLDHGGAIVWTATLYDVDTKSYFVMAFDRESLRVYRFGELAGRFDTHFGLPQFPRGERERLWRAWGGCIDAAARPEVVIPWAEVREIKAGNWVLYFKLTHKVRITSDRGKKADVDEIKVNLHGGSGSIDVRTTSDPIDPWKVDVHTVGIGPLAYQERIRRTLVALVDPDNRIVLPKASRSAGW